MNGEGAISYRRRVAKRLSTLLGLEAQIVMELKTKYEMVKVIQIMICNTDKISSYDNYN